MFTLTISNFTTNIKAMENKTEEEKNIKNEIIENFKLERINEYFLGDIKDCKKKIYYFKINPHKENKLVYQKEKHNNLK